MNNPKPKDVVKNIQKNFRQNIKPSLDKIEKRTRRIGNITIVDLRGGDVK